MKIVDPIRDLNDIERVKTKLKTNKERNLLLFLLGINSGLRISDLLNLKISDVKDKSYVEITEQKTRKFKRFPLANHLKILISQYVENKEPNEWLFPSQKGNKAISRVQAYRIITFACKEAGIKENIGTHSLRKTFGYHLYKQTKDVALLQNIFNHSSPYITLRYIGITQEAIDLQLKLFTL